MSGVKVYEPATGTPIDATQQGDGSMRQNVTVYPGATFTISEAHLANLDTALSVLLNAIETYAPGASSDTRGLTERMFAKAPKTGYHLYLDGANADGYTYIAEAPNGATSPSTAWQGIRLLTSGASAVQTCLSFDWANRTTATWSS